MDSSDGYMRFVVSTKHAAENNSEEAKLREATRIALIAHALDQLGHAVVFRDVHPLLMRSNRWKTFSHIPVDRDVSGRTIAPTRGPHSTGFTDVLVKCSVGCGKDRYFSSLCSVLVAHERSGGIQNAVDIPFFVHDRLVQELADRELLDAYARDDLKAIRSEFFHINQRDVGFVGMGWRHRKEFFHNAPEWVHKQFYDTHPMTAWEHAQWLCECRAAVALPGDTPKTNLPPLLLLLGVPMISPMIENNRVPLDGDSMILFESWDQVKEVVDDDRRLASIAAHAEEKYLEGWSPLGVAKQILWGLRNG